MGTQPLAPGPRNARRSSPFSIAFIVIGGFIGMLAGYGLLAIIRDHGSNLKPPVETADSNSASREPRAAPKQNPTAQQSVAVTKTNLTPPTAGPPSQPQYHDLAVSQVEAHQPAEPANDVSAHGKARPNRRRRGQAVRASEATLKIATNDTHSPSTSPADSIAPPLPPPDQPSHSDSTNASESAGPSLPPPSSPSEQSSHDSTQATAAIVSLTLKQDVIRVIALPEEVPADSLLCDIGFSPELTGHQLPTGTYDMVAERLGKRGEYRQELPLNMNGAGATIEIKIRQQNKAAICEIRPKFSLPMSGIKQLTIASGSILQKSLNRTLNNTLNAEQALPGMRDQLDNLKGQLADAIERTSEPGSNVNDTSSLRIQWRAKAHQLQLAVNKLSKDIPRAEQLVANKSALETDIADLDQISQYAEKIASNASLSVRFYNGDETIPATVK